MSKISKRNFNSEFKYKVVKEALTTDTSITDICKKYEIGTNVYYKWQETFLKSALCGFNGESVKQSKEDNQEIAKLKEENLRLKTAVSELVSDNIELKKKSNYS